MGVRFEFRRKAFHIVSGTIAAWLMYYDQFPRLFMTGFLVFSLVLSFLATRYRILGVQFLIDFFDRDLHKRTFPGKGAIFLLAGAVASAWLFPKPAALVAIITVTMGDSISHLVGRFGGTYPNPLNPEKNIEGFIAGVLTATFFNALIVPPLIALSISVVGMIVESIRVPLGWLSIDDNLSIPLSAGVTYLLLAALL